MIHRHTNKTTPKSTKNSSTVIQMLLSICLIFLIGLSVTSCAKESQNSADTTQQITDLPPTPPSPSQETVDADSIVVVTSDDEIFGEII
jgi:hypothetical protein